MPNTKIPARNSLGILKFLKLEFLFLFRIRIFFGATFFTSHLLVAQFLGVGEIFYIREF